VFSDFLIKEKINMKNTLRVRFLGAIGTVTSSCTLLEYYSCEDNKKRYFLVDIGSFVKEK